MDRANGGRACGVELEVVIDNLPSAVIVVDGERRVLLANRMAACFASRTKQELLGRRGGEAFGCVEAPRAPTGCGSAPACELCVVRRTVRDTFADRGDRSLLETTMTFEGQGTRDLRVSTTFLLVRETPAVLVALEDVTLLKAQEQIRLDNERLRAALATGGAVCHRMNQPLTVLSASLQLLGLEARGSRVVLERIAVMQSQLDALSAITGKLLHLQAYKTVEYVKNTRILDIDSATHPDGLPELDRSGDLLRGMAGDGRPAVP